jgi:tetratricopeptide (TPR) repeat protein
MIERQLAALREGNVGGELPSALANSARVLASLGDAGEARRRRLEAERLVAAHAARGRAGAGWIHQALGRACVLLGDLDDAERLAGLAMAAASTRTDFVPDTLHLLGDIASHPDRFDAGDAHRRYDEALSLADQRGMRPLVAHCHLGLGTLCASTDRRAQATRHLETAAAMYQDLDMPGWREEAVAVSSGLA